MPSGFPKCLPVLHPQPWLSLYEGSRCSPASLTLCIISNLYNYCSVMSRIPPVLILMKAWSSNYAAVKKLCCMFMPHHTISRVSTGLYRFWDSFLDLLFLIHSHKNVLPTCWWIEKKAQGLGNKILLLFKKKKSEF